MVTSLQKPMSVKSKMECISSSSAAYCGPTSGHQELARQKEKLKEKLEHCRCHLIKVWNGYYYFTTQTNYIWLLQSAPTKIDIFTECWDVENRSASGCISSVPALARCWATKSGCAGLVCCVDGGLSLVSPSVMQWTPTNHHLHCSTSEIYPDTRYCPHYRDQSFKRRFLKISQSRRRPLLGP